MQRYKNLREIFFIHDIKKMATQIPETKTIAPKTYWKEYKIDI
jgi:hypothetical protein